MQVLGHVFKLVDMVPLKVLEQQQQDSRNGLNNNLFVEFTSTAASHALQHCGGHLLRQDICWDVDQVCCGFEVGAVARGTVMYSSSLGAGLGLW